MQVIIPLQREDHDFDAAIEWCADREQVEAFALCDVPRWTPDGTQRTGSLLLHAGEEIALSLAEQQAARTELAWACRQSHRLLSH